MLSWVAEVTIATQSFVSVIANLPAPAELVITLVDDHIKIKLTSKLINDISRALKKLLKYLMI